MNDLELKAFSRSKQTLQSKGKLELAERIASEIVENMYDPISVQGTEFNGDVFYSAIDGWIRSSIPKSKTLGQKQTEIAMFDYVTGRLKQEGFYVHS